MLPADVIGLFLASVALALAPGPDNIFVLTQSAIHGRLTGLFVTLGLCTGILGHTAAVALGVAAVLETSTVAFNGLKIAGATYLVYLAWHAFRSEASEMPTDGSPPRGRAAAYARGVVMNITYSKVAIFFLAFLPQFADPTLGPVTAQIVGLGALFMGATFLVFGSIAWAAGLIGDWMRRSTRAQIAMNRVAGLVFLSLAVKLAVVSR